MPVDLFAHPETLPAPVPVEVLDHHYSKVPIKHVSVAFGQEMQIATPRFELFLLGDGEKKVIVTPETRVPSAAIFTFNKEDHTLGNLLRSRLLQNPHVQFSAYKIPHPLFATFDLRVQTDGTLTPREAVVQACRDIVQDLDVLGREFTKEWELKKISKMGDGMNGL